jgi:hypothetical protein
MGLRAGPDDATEALRSGDGTCRHPAGRLVTRLSPGNCYRVAQKMLSPSL